MIDGLRPYAEMRPSGVEWLPVLPAGWEIHRAKYSFREADNRSEAGDEELLSVSHKTGVTPRSQKNITMFMAESYEGHKVCRPGDVVVNTMWAWMAAIGVSRHLGIVSPAYGIYRPRAADRFEPRFLDYLLRTEVYRAEYLRSSRGVTTSRLRLYPPDFLNIPFVQPPLDEQQLIVRFLDWHGAQTAKLIRAKKKIIALLNEQKQAIIHRAVTRGLDPNVRLKPSGIPWLGDVPVGWELKPLKRITRSRCDGPFGSGLKSSHYSGSGIFVVRLQNIGIGDFVRKEKAFISREHYSTLGDHSVLPNDILIASLGDELRPCGRACVAPNDLGEAMVKADCFRFRLETECVNSSFVAAYLTATARHSSAMLSAGATRQRVNLEATAQRAVALPPLEEQHRILDWIKSATESVDKAAATTQSEIALIQEFRTRLIADLVTGKLDVQAAAASLPEDIEPDPIADLIEGDDLDEAVEDSENEEVAA